MRNNIKASGFQLFWTAASWSNPAALKEGFWALGLQGFEPTPMTPSPALREALCDFFRGKNVMVRPLKKEGGFVVVDESRGEADNQYRKMFSVVLQGDSGLQLAFDPLPEGAQEIANLYAKRLNSVAGHAIGQCLVKLVDKFRGTAIRKTGGIYWLHHQHFDIFEGVRRVIEASATFGDSIVYLPTLEVDAESIRVVKDAIQREILQESKNILDEMLKGDVGERAMKTRLEYLDSLQAKVAEYEGIVGQSLKHLAEALDNTKTASGLGAFQEMMRGQTA